MARLQSLLKLRLSHLASEDLSKLGLESFCCLSKSLGQLPCNLVTQTIPGLSSKGESALSPRNLSFFWVRSVTVWVLGMLVAIGLVIVS